jgi:hypothetical protein
MATVHIYTSKPEDVPMKKQENLDITIDQSCSWCFLDPDGVFGSPSALLGNGTYYKTIPSTTYGLFVPVKAGNVKFNAVPVGTDCTDKTLGPHTIIVTG